MSSVTEDEALPVSVIIPVLDGATTLPRALSGVAAQRPLRAAQVIVVDDGSSDGSGDVAQRLGATVLRHEVNQRRRRCAQHRPRGRQPTVAGLSGRR
jgi:glycosyltransferase involved in cell wall biosynthesis